MWLAHREVHHTARVELLAHNAGQLRLSAGCGQPAPAGSATLLLAAGEFCTNI
jgi:hypothetical protein